MKLLGLQNGGKQPPRNAEGADEGQRADPAGTAVRSGKAEDGAAADSGAGNNKDADEARPSFNPAADMLERHEQLLNKIKRR